MNRKGQETVLLTGATGFLGSRILFLLVKNGFRVVAVRRAKSSLRRVNQFTRHPAVRWCDSERGLENCFKTPITHIVHAATVYGREPATYAEVVSANLVLPLRLLEFGARHSVRTFINADTFFYPRLGLAPKEKSYIITKKLFLDTARQIIKPTALKFLNLRIEQMYGPGDSAEKFVGQMIEQLRGGASLRLTPGNQKRDFVYVDDVAAAFIKALQNYRADNQYQEFGIGTGKSVSIKTTVRYLKKILHSKTRLIWGALPYRAHEIMNSQASLKNNKLIGWSARVDWQTGLKKTIRAK